MSPPALGLSCHLSQSKSPPMGPPHRGDSSVPSPEGGHPGGAGESPAPHSPCPGQSGCEPAKPVLQVQLRTSPHQYSCSKYTALADLNPALEFPATGTGRTHWCHSGPCSPPCHSTSPGAQMGAPGVGLVCCSAPPGTGSGNVERVLNPYSQHSVCTCNSETSWEPRGFVLASPAD